MLKAVILNVGPKSLGSEQSSRRSKSAFCCLLFAVCCLLFTGACRMDMHDQPKMKPYRSAPFFSDGLSSRPQVEGTVARGFLRTDSEYFTGKKQNRVTASVSLNSIPAGPQPSTPNSGSPATSNAAAPMGPAAYPDDIEVFPIAVTKEVVTRGKERYQIYCSACHGMTGNGDGMIVRRGFRRAASFNDDRLRQAPVGHYFDAITNGWGAMPSYAPQVPVQDRWAIIAYIKALQLKNEMEQVGSTPAAATTAPEAGGHK